MRKLCASVAFVLGAVWSGRVELRLALERREYSAEIEALLLGYSKGGDDCAMLQALKKMRFEGAVVIS